MDELIFEGTHLKIDSKNGAAITYWECRKNNQPIALINNRGINSYESSLLFPFPNRLSRGNYNFEGQNYQFPLNDFGKPNALHGLIHSEYFRSIDSGENYLKFAYIYEGDKEFYPFPYQLRIEYKLHANELEINVDVINTGEGNMPCGFGWHPYFDLQLVEKSCRLKLPEVSKIEVDENMIPIAKEAPYRDFQELNSIFDKSLDTCFRLEKMGERSSTFLSYPELGTLEVWQDTSCPFVQVFKYDERSIAIEPMTCGIDAFNTKEGLKVLKPQQVWSTKMGLKFY